MPDPLDKQLVEAVLTRPRRAKADVEEAKLATRGLRAAKVALQLAVAPFVGLAYLIVLPFAALGMLAWMGAKAAFARAPIE